MRVPIGLAIVMFAGSAHAFVPTLTCTESGLYQCRAGEEPKQVKWSKLCVNWYLNDAGSSDIPLAADGTLAAELESAVTASFDAWNEVSCQNLKLVYGGLTDDNRSATDGTANIVVWRDDWRYASKTAFAITSVTYNPDTGLIADADIELNDEFNRFTTALQGAEIDVQNTLTHEVGHFVGLDHSNLIAATMFANAGVGETQKRSLEQDDRDGVCSIYPTEMRDDACAEAPPHTKDSADDEDEGCCATAPARRSATPWGLVALLAGVMLIRRRHARA